MMFVIKGVTNLSSVKEGELAIVSYQDQSGNHNMSFYFDKEEIYTDFTLNYGEVLAKLDKRPQNIVAHSNNTYISVLDSTFELVDLNVYTQEDKDSKKNVKEDVSSTATMLQRVRRSQFMIHGLETAVRVKSHMKQYGMKGITLAMKLAWENPVKYEDIDNYPIPPYYADFEALTDIVYLDYTIKDYSTKSVLELAEEVDPLEDEELEEILEEYEEYEEEYLEEDNEDEIEMEIPNITRKRPVKNTIEEVLQDVVVEPVVEEKKTPKSTTQQGKTNAQPRDKSGKFTKKKK